MKICILGTGAYGIALAAMCNENNHDIIMWTKFNDEKKELEEKGFSPKMPTIQIPQNIKFTTSMEEAVNEAELIIIVVPTAFVDDVAKELKFYFKKEQHICIASKGIENDSCKFAHEVVKSYIKTRNIAVISGGTFAIDMANHNPVGLSLAYKNKQTMNVVKRALQNNTLKLRKSSDILGCEICGSIKNVIAIASGMLSGLGYSESTQAMFITESLHDIKELIGALGGKRRTILSFAGFSDILLTCTSTKSRNFSFGKIIGEKKPKSEIKKYMETTTIEGLYTLKSINKLIKNKKVNIPIIDLIYDIIYNNVDPKELAIFLINKK